MGNLGHVLRILRKSLTQWAWHVLRNPRALPKSPNIASNSADIAADIPQRSIRRHTSALDDLNLNER